MLAAAVVLDQLLTLALASLKVIYVQASLCSDLAVFNFRLELGLHLMLDYCLPKHKSILRGPS